MKKTAVELLRCPFCLDSIQVAATYDESAGDIEVGILECAGCRFEFPVICGIAILMGPDDRIDLKNEVTASIMSGGPRVRKLVQLIRSGKPVEALARLLGPVDDEGALFPRLQTSAWKGRSHGRSVERVEPDGTRQSERPARSGRVPGRLHGPVRIARLWSGRLRVLAKLLLLPWARSRLARFLQEHANELSALDAIALYYGQYSGSEMENYFAFRFGQPRHLASLGLASLLARTHGPILDLACGAGHLTHYLTNALPDRQVFGLDRAFFRLLIARRYVAPAADFICGNADRALPFGPGSLGGVFCSDAFHCFLDRAATVRESQRLAAERGLIVFTRFGNAEVAPREGYELPLEKYRALLGGWPHVFFGEDELLDLYLQQRSPDLRHESASAELRRQKWLSVVLARHPEDLDDAATFAEWPHSLGDLRVNPIYVGTSSSTGDLELEFRFPSTWYAFENHRYLDYAPKECGISKADLESLGRGERSPSVEQLIAQCVVIGMPDRYEPTS